MGSGNRHFSLKSPRLSDLPYLNGPILGLKKRIQESLRFGILSRSTRCCRTETGTRTHRSPEKGTAPLVQDPLNAVRFIVLAAVSSYINSWDLLGSAAPDPRWEPLEFRRNGDQQGAFRPASYRAGAEATWCAVVSHPFADAGARL